MFKYQKCVVVHRINGDERKNTKFMNFKLRIANFCADQTVIVGEWMKNLNIYYNEQNKKILTIRNGSNKKILIQKDIKYGIKKLNLNW